MSEIGFLSHPPPEPDFWIYFASYLRNAWVQGNPSSILAEFSPSLFPTPTATNPTNEKENKEEAGFNNIRQGKKTKHG
ncbi:hypothetical protein POVCU1_029090 [Plasmodium ovale curtisi]|uniref:Uncharacterized protein n=1 Tax=Plasmodium ovale curtisi TaxID=864141 RepID=A0A1A8WUR8_PLAOA|nr:hypothetical protein POVCU1_029090 [Plasmodium ovale curtisi]